MTDAPTGAALDPEWDNSRIDYTGQDDSKEVVRNAEDGDSK